MKADLANKEADAEITAIEKINKAEEKSLQGTHQESEKNGFRQHHRLSVPSAIWSEPCMTGNWIR